jgi:hypothetical protein
MPVVKAGHRKIDCMTTPSVSGQAVSGCPAAGSRSGQWPGLLVAQPVVQSGVAASGADTGQARDRSIPVIRCRPKLFAQRYGPHSPFGLRDEAPVELAQTKTLRCLAAPGGSRCERRHRLVEVLKSHGMAANQQVTFLTDAGEDIRDIPCYLNAQAEHLLDWFHITMRITVMVNMAKSLHPPPPDPDRTSAVGGHISA